MRAAQTHNWRPSVLAPVIIAMIAATCGSQSALAQTNWLNKPKKPDRMTVVWTDTVLNQTAKIGIRGLGGRVMFFSNEKSAPVKVDGTLTVFAYDDTDGDTTKNIPSRKFVFPADKLEGHYSKSVLGHSYSFWLPWDPVGGERRVLTIVCRFEPSNGPMIVGDPVRQILPGKASEDEQHDAAADESAIARLRQQSQPAAMSQGQQPALAPVPNQSNSRPASRVAGQVQATSYTAAVEHQPLDAPQRSRLQSSTITLPPSYRLREQPAQPGLQPLGQQGTQVEAANHPGLASGEAAFYPPPEQAPAKAPSEAAAAAPSGAGPDPAVVAAAAELLARALANQAAQEARPQPVAGSAPSPPRARGGSVPPLKRDRVPMRPRPPGWPTGHPSSPEGALGGAAPTLVLPAPAAGQPAGPPRPIAP